MREIRQLANQIAEKFEVEKIILFGSYAYGKPRAGSDVDLCVIMNNGERPFKQSLNILRSLSPLYFGVDIVVCRPDDFARRIPQGDFFLQDIWEKGRVLYEHRGS